MPFAFYSNIEQKRKQAELFRLDERGSSLPRAGELDYNRAMPVLQKPVTEVVVVRLPKTLNARLKGLAKRRRRTRWRLSPSQMIGLRSPLTC
jgi:hypothetical protein